LAVTDWRLRRWRLWFLALMTATRQNHKRIINNKKDVFFKMAKDVLEVCLGEFRYDSQEKRKSCFFST